MTNGHLRAVKGLNQTRKLKLIWIYVIYNFFVLFLFCDTWPFVRICDLKWSETGKKYFFVASSNSRSGHLSAITLMKVNLESANYLSIYRPSATQLACRVIVSSKLSFWTFSQIHGIGVQRQTVYPTSDEKTFRNRRESHSSLSVCTSSCKIDPNTKCYDGVVHGRNEARVSTRSLRILTFRNFLSWHLSQSVPRHRKIMVEGRLFMYGSFQYYRVE